LLGLAQRLIYLQWAFIPTIEITTRKQRGTGMFKTMSVSQALVVGSLIIAAAILLSKESSSKMIPLANGIVIHTDLSTGTASVCTLKQNDYGAEDKYKLECTKPTDFMK
jgi:hypothetical protein